jgi:biotin carboxylase
MDSKPLLAVVHSPRSRPWWEIAEAAAGLCRLLWIVDESAVGTTDRVLRKLGKVIDTAGCTEEEVIATVRAEGPNGITSYFDDDLHRQASLSTALGLTGPTVDVVARLNDKLLQRRALEAAGLPVPRFTAINEILDGAEIDRLCETLTFPLLLKPRDGTASRDIHSIEDREELIIGLKEIVRPSDMILEERMADTSRPDPFADQVCVETIVSRGASRHLGILGYFPIAPPFRLSGLFFPADIPGTEVTELFGLATESIGAIGAEIGCFRTEIKRTPDGWKIIEINGRPSGVTPALVQLASGVPLLELYMRHALGEHVVFDTPAPCGRIAYRYFREPPTTALRVGMISRLNELRERDGVLEIDAFKEVGDRVDWRNGSLDRVFQVTGTAADYAELAEHYRACSADAFVTYEFQHHNVPLA